MRVTGSKQCRVNAVWRARTAQPHGVGCVWGKQCCCDVPLPGEADVEEIQLEACFPGQGGSTGNREMDAGGALGHWVPHIHSRRVPSVFASLIFRESDSTFAPSKMILLGQIQQVMTLCVKSRHFNSYTPKLMDEGFFKHKAAVLLSCSCRQAKHHKLLLKSCKLLGVLMVLKSSTLLGEGALEGWDDALLCLKFFHVSYPSDAALSSALRVSHCQAST